MFSIAVVQTKVISCNCVNKSYLLQVVHTKAIAVLTQFCDFFKMVWEANWSVEVKSGVQSVDHSVCGHLVYRLFSLKTIQLKLV